MANTPPLEISQKPIFDDDEVSSASSPATVYPPSETDSEESTTPAPFSLHVITHAPQLGDVVVIRALGLDHHDAADKPPDVHVLQLFDGELLIVLLTQGLGQTLEGCKWRVTDWLRRVWESTRQQRPCARCPDSVLICCKRSPGPCQWKCSPQRRSPKSNVLDQLTSHPEKNFRDKLTISRSLLPAPHVLRCVPALHSSLWADSPGQGWRDVVPDRESPASRGTSGPYFNTCAALKVLNTHSSFTSSLSQSSNCRPPVQQQANLHPIHRQPSSHLPATRISKPDSKMAGRALPMKHIDRKELYTSLEARVQYLHTFLDFSSRDIEALITGGKYIRALIPAVVTIVYRKLLQYDITARAFTTRSTSFEGPMDEIPTEDSPQILHRKMFLKAYLTKLCSDPSQMEFWEYLDKVGMMHVGLGRTHPLHIEYVHIGMTLGLVQDILTEAILSHPKLSMGRKMALVKALGKVIWIQNDLFAKWYVHDGEEFTDGVDYAPVIEREGWLKGKRAVKVDEESESGRSDGTEKADGEGKEKVRFECDCPFAGVGKKMGGLKVDEKTAGEGKAPEA